MANRLISPSLADVSQDIAGIIPLDIILKWANLDKNSKSQEKLLAPFIVKGTVVSSDSSGLSKLTKNKTLLEVMKLVSKPKELIFSYGVEIGGVEIGIWAADNTQMFYKSDIKQDMVIKQMIGAQNEIKNLEVQVGMGIHTGSFISIGGGLFGEDADYIEHITENYAKAGEIIVTKKSKNKNSYLSFDYKNLNLKVNKSKDYKYPYPFSTDFFEILRSDRKDKNKVYKKYSREKIVILVKVMHKDRNYLLDQLSQWVLANTILKQITRLTGIEEIKSNGSLGIFVTDNTEQAIQFATDLKDTMAANGYVANVGISKGEVLIFPLKSGIKEIAGGSVNIASKMAEDSGGEGEVLIESSVDLKGQKTPKLTKFAIQLSSVELTGYKF